VNQLSVDSVVVKLEARIDELVVNRRITGIACGLIFDQQIVWSKGFGFADIEFGRTPDARTIFRCGSITKTFTATAIMQLRDEGRLSLEDPVVRYLPEFSNVKASAGDPMSVTLRQLLSHHSGLVGEPPFGHWESLKFPTMDQILSSLQQTEIAIAPNSAFKYSNLAFALLGEVITRTSGVEYEKYVTNNILAPLNMTHSGFYVDGPLREKLAKGYEPVPFEEAPRAVADDHTGGLSPAGQLYSNVEDLAKWVSLQFRAEERNRRDQQVLAGRSLDEMHQPYRIEPGWTLGYCLPWIAGRRNDTVFHQHAGGMTGFRSTIAFSKGDRIGVVVLTNLDGHESCGEIALAIFDEATPLISTSAHRAAFQPPSHAPAEYQRFLGRYEWVRAGLVMDIEWKAGRLVLSSHTASSDILPAPSPLSPTTDPCIFIVEGGRPAGERIVFRVDATSKVIALFLQEAAYRKGL
jgi:D-alanyl-D-alanine carboxypeptidase